MGRDTVCDEKMVVWVCEKGHVDDYHGISGDGNERCSRCGGRTEESSVAKLVAENTTLRERGDAVADSINRWFAAEDWPGGEPEAGERRLDARDGLRQAQANWRKATGDDRDGSD